MDVNKVIATLKEDYELRKSLMRKNFSVQEELEDEIFDLEESYITSWVMPKIEAYAKELLKDLECEVFLSILKNIHGDLRVGNEPYIDMPIYFDTETGNIAVLPEIPLEEEEPIPAVEEPTTVMPSKSRSSSIGFSVSFPDGTVIRRNNAKDTFIESLRKIGFDRLSGFSSRTFYGYHLVGKTKRTDGDKKWQEKVGDWYIYINISNDTKIKVLEMISDEYHLGLSIERDDETAIVAVKTDKYKKPYNPEAELVVEFPDGTVYDDKKAIWNFVRAIEKIGFEKVAKVGIDIVGYNLVDTKKRTDKGRTWQKHVGPYYVYSYLSNGDKIKYLNQISNHYNLGLKIVTQ